MTPPVKIPAKKSLKKLNKKMKKYMAWVDDNMESMLNMKKP
jgi:hypothetical protein